MRLSGMGVIGLVGVGVCCLVASSVQVACAGKKGGLVLAIDTDMKAPKDLNIISLSVLVNNQVKVNYQGRVTPDGTVLLPATLALTEPQDTGASIRIRVVGFQERRARVLRDVRTTIPTDGRVALLRLPLAFVNDGSGAGEIPAGVDIDGKQAGTGGTGATTSSSSSGGASSGGLFDGGTSSGGASSGGASSGGASSGGASSGGGFGAGELNPYEIVSSSCPLDQTTIDGECTDDYVDSSSLPEYSPELVGSGQDQGNCFDAKKVFANATQVTQGQVEIDGGRDEAPAPLDAGMSGDRDFRPAAVSLDLSSCSLNLGGQDPARLNLAIVTPDTGECLRPGECYVPVDVGDIGHSAGDPRIGLPKFVCKLLSKSFRLFHAVGAPAKKASNPICLDTVLPDAGATATSGLVVAEEFPTSVRVSGSSLFLVGSTRASRVDLAEGMPRITPIEGFTGGRIPWIFGAGVFGLPDVGGPVGRFALTNATSKGYLYNGSSLTPVDLAPAAVANGVMYDSLQGRYLFGATGGAGIGGVYATQGLELVASRLNLAPTNPDDVTAIFGGGGSFAYGTSKGDVAMCDSQVGSCGPLVHVTDGRVDAITFSSSTAGLGFVLTSNGVSSVAPQGLPRSLKAAPTAGVTNGSGYFPHALASNDKCVFYTSADGVGWVSVDGGPGGSLASVPAGGNALGIALAPRAGGSSGTLAVYYTVFAGLSVGGGLYVVDVPPQCASGTNMAADAGADLCAGDGQSCAAMPCCPPLFCEPSSKICLPGG